MKTLNTKILTLTYFLTLTHLFCLAQIKIAELKDGTINKAIIQRYIIKKTTKNINIDNAANKFIDIKQNSPNLPINITPSKFDILVDKDNLIKICAKYITMQQAETLAGGGKYAGLMIEIKTDIYGNTIEVGFFTDQNSILTLQQLEQIEDGVKAMKIVTIVPEIRKYLEGSNFWMVRPIIYYDALLKVKQETTPSQRTKDHRRL